MFHSLQEHVAWYELTQLARTLPKKTKQYKQKQHKKRQKGLKYITELQCFVHTGKNIFFKFHSQLQYLLPRY